MNKTKIVAVILIALMLISMFSSCGFGVEAQLRDKETGTRIVVDCIGREVEIPEKIEAVGCLYAFSGHITALLGEEDKIVAVVDGLKRDQLLTGLFPDILEKPVPFTEGSINIEELVKLNPDVVFIRTSTAENQGEMEKLASFGIPAVVVDSNTIKEQRASVIVAGEVFGGAALEKAKQYETLYREAMDVASEKAEKLKPDEIVSVFHSINEATRTDAKGTITAEWTTLVGVNNVSVNQELSILEGKMYAGLEQIYIWNPELIICNEPGVRDYIMKDAKWSGLQAVKDHAVIQMPIAISRWGHPGSMETPLAIYWLGKQVYPELYADVDLVGKTRDFYQIFFDYKLSDEEISLIFSGEGMRKEKNDETAN